MGCLPNDWGLQLLSSAPRACNSAWSVAELMKCQVHRWVEGRGGTEGKRCHLASEHKSGLPGGPRRTAPSRSSHFLLKGGGLCSRAWIHILLNWAVWLGGWVPCAAGPGTQRWGTSYVTGHGGAGLACVHSKPACLQPHPGPVQRDPLGESRHGSSSGGLPTPPSWLPGEAWRRGVLLLPLQSTRRPDSHQNSMCREAQQPSGRRALGGSPSPALPESPACLW